ncbi:uncharacterized protein KD926_002587 [Aspergillus affinis]|uniref:uncharacterized protein n=1 Tax=Aspergillus affinis TaxID=1070780 RepID=UPI0022FDF0F9|nr:uncharacterized protein KD926_002587 [Aspergillus affinis]KAI9035975.1 hypothetical protein KD926_002587 [Aspergillus affinis]
MNTHRSSMSSPALGNVEVTRGSYYIYRYNGAANGTSGMTPPQSRPISYTSSSRVPGTSTTSRRTGCSSRSNSTTRGVSSVSPMLSHTSRPSSMSPMGVGSRSSRSSSMHPGSSIYPASPMHSRPTSTARPSYTTPTAPNASNTAPPPPPPNSAAGHSTARSSAMPGPSTQGRRSSSSGPNNSSTTQASRKPRYSGGFQLSSNRPKTSEQGASTKKPPRKGCNQQ